MNQDHEERLRRLESLYRARVADFVRMATAITGDREVARDAVQDGFAEAVRTRERLRDDGALEAWVWRIVVNRARKERGRIARLRVTAVATSSNGHRDDADAIREAIAELPERQRHVLFLRYYADLDYAAIADALHIRPGTVAATLNQAHAALRSRLEGLTR